MREKLGKTELFLGFERKNLTFCWCWAPILLPTISTRTRTHLSPCTRVDKFDSPTTTLAATPARSELLIRICRRKPQPSPLYTYTLTALTAALAYSTCPPYLFLRCRFPFAYPLYTYKFNLYISCRGFPLKFSVEVRAFINLFHPLYTYIYTYTFNRTY